MTVDRGCTRSLDRYDPHADAAIRWPHWTFTIIPLDGGHTEVIAPSIRTAFLDVGAYLDDPDYAVAHVVAHLDYHMDELGIRMTSVQEECANDVAALRLDRIDFGL